MEDQKLRQLFKNRSNCYAASEEVIQAMDEDRFTETVIEILTEEHNCCPLPPTEFLAKKGLLGKKDITISDNRLLSLLSEYKRSGVLK
jgi:hypothetical protein